MPMEKIDLFREENFFLSNFYFSNVLYDGIKYPTAEHAYQAAKTKKLADKHSIRQIATPGQAKRAGSRVTLRENWEEVKLSEMRTIVWLKFNQSQELAGRLLSTGEAELIEGNTWGDIFWGKCRGVRRNELGKILMRVREELRKDTACS